MQPLASKLTRTLATTGLLLCAAVSTSAADDADRIGAIRALYGEGLKVETSGDSVSIDWGALDESTYRRYVKAHYQPALADWEFPLNLMSEIAFFGTIDHKNKRAAHILVEPLEKLDLCETLAKGIGDEARKNKALDYCRTQALRHATAPVVAFRGSAVSYSKPTRFTGVDLGDDLYDSGVLITIAGPGAGSFDALYTVKWIANNLRSGAPEELERLANDAKFKAEAAIERGKVKIARRDARLRKPRGNILVTDKWVDGWNPIKSISRKAVPTCKSAFAHLYGPKKRGYYAVEVSTNKMMCKDVVYSAKFAKHWRIGSICRKHLRPGENKIEVAISKNINKDTGKRRVYVSKTRVRGEKVYSNRAGKRLVTKSITCTR